MEEWVSDEMIPKQVSMFAFSKSTLMKGTAVVCTSFQHVFQKRGEMDLFNPHRWVPVN